MKIEINLTEDSIKSCKDSLSDWFGVIITDEQLEVVLNDEKKIATDLEKYNYVDTSTREDLIEGVIECILGMDRSWPIGKDSKEYKKDFYIDFIRLSKENNLEINWSDEEIKKLTEE